VALGSVPWRGFGGVRTASGATAVQIAEYDGGRRKIVAHVGSAHTEAELGILLERAREMLADPAQGTFDLGIEPAAPWARLVEPAARADPVRRGISWPGPGSRGTAAGPTCRGGATRRLPTGPPPTTTTSCGLNSCSSTPTAD
jgi:hypothetical protein